MINNVQILDRDDKDDNNNNTTMITTITKTTILTSARGFRHVTVIYTTMIAGYLLGSKVVGCKNSYNLEKSP